MPIKVNGYQIVPAPIVTFSKNYLRNNGSGTFGSEFTITLNGTLIATKGNPVSSGTTPSIINVSGSPYSTFSPDDDPLTPLQPDALLNAIMKKQEYLRYIFGIGQAAGSGTKLEITAFNEDKGIKAYCDVDNISFDDRSRWTNVCGYTVNLRGVRFFESSNGLFSTDTSEDNFQYYVSDIQNTWTFQEQDQYTASTGNIYDQNKMYTVSHNVSAVGQRVYTSSGTFSSPIQQASGYVNNVLGLGSGYIPSNMFGLPTGLTVYNRKFVENINIFNGSYSIDEEFTLAPNQGASEQINISIDNDLGALTRVNINGTINGFNSLSPLTRSVNKYVNASGYWASVSGRIWDRANAYLDGACTLNSVPLSTSIGKNITEGVITYNYSYDNRPSNFIANALTEDIEINDTYPGQIINVVPVIGRSQPIIQYVNSRSEYKRSLQITAVMKPSGCTIVKPSIAELTTIFDYYKPQGTKVYYGPPTENWNPKTGQYTYNVEFTFEGASLFNNY